MPQVVPTMAHGVLKKPQKFDNFAIEYWNVNHIFIKILTIFNVSSNLFFWHFKKALIAFSTPICFSVSFKLFIVKLFRPVATEMILNFKCGIDVWIWRLVVDNYLVLVWSSLVCLPPNQQIYQSWSILSLVYLICCEPWNLGICAN